jgi:hypothetical protein
MWPVDGTAALIAEPTKRDTFLFVGIFVGIYFLNQVKT